MFVIELIYKAALARIDAEMPAHMKFLKKYYASGHFLVSGRKIPRGDRSWIMGLRGHNINNAASAVVDYRTGEVLAYVGSASYTSKGNRKFQPQFDVLADGWRQPGSSR